MMKRGVGGKEEVGNFPRRAAEDCYGGFASFREISDVLLFFLLRGFAALREIFFDTGPRLMLRPPLGASLRLTRLRDRHYPHNPSSIIHEIFLIKRKYAAG
jgi:hypothetical protein